MLKRTKSKQRGEVSLRVLDEKSRKKNKRLNKSKNREFKNKRHTMKNTKERRRKIEEIEAIEIEKDSMRKIDLKSTNIEMRKIDQEIEKTKIAIDKSKDQERKRRRIKKETDPEKRIRETDLTVINDESTEKTADYTKCIIIQILKILKITLSDFKNILFE